MPKGSLTLHVLTVSPLDAALASFLLAHEAARHSPKTLQHYHYTAGGFVAWLKEQGILDVAHVKADHIRRYLIELQRRSLKDTTQHAHARGIKTFFNWLVENDYIDHSPMWRVKMPKLEQRVPPPFSREEIRSLLNACNRRTIQGARDYALILVLLDTGLRAQEICSLKVGQVDMRSGVTAIMGKGGKERQIRVGDKARGAILRYLSMRGEEARKTDPLWLSFSRWRAVQGPLQVNGLRSALRRVGDIAGVHPCSPHRFRRTFALWCLRDGMDMESLRKLMGHSNFAVISRYLRLAGEDIERVHRAHSPVDNILQIE